MLRRTTRSVQFLALATVVAIGCDESSGPLSSESQPGPSFSAAAAKTPFTATWTNSSVVDLPPDPFFPGGSAHFWNDVNSGPIVGDLEGTVIAVTDLNTGLVTGKGPLTGTMELVLDGGGFVGRLAGIFDYSIGLSEGHFQGQGTGAYAGQKINGTYSNAPGGFVFAMEGDIVDPKP